MGLDYETVRPSKIAAFAVDDLDRVDSMRDAHADRRRRHSTWIHIVKRRHPSGSLVHHSPFTPWAPGGWPSEFARLTAR
jgi:hypothetical protein